MNHHQNAKKKMEKLQKFCKKNSAKINRYFALLPDDPEWEIVGGPEEQWAWFSAASWGRNEFEDLR
jgi:hypothetical protein